MRSMTSGRWAAVLVFVIVAGAEMGSTDGAALAQPAPPTADALLTEVRGLRADLHQAAGASIRAQLLVARLQLQEQRINVLSGQLADLRRQLVEHQTALFATSDQVTRMEGALQNPALDPDPRKDLEANLPSLKSRFAQMRREDQLLRSQEGELLNLIATEQGRWNDFNTRLDELERQLPPR